MKILKSGLTLFDFSVCYRIGNVQKCLVVKDKGSKSQAVGQIKKTVGGQVEVISVQKK